MDNKSAARKLYGTRPDNGVPIITIRKKQPAAGGNVKTKAMPSRATHLKNRN